jgi:O-Antigen ligase
VIVVILAFGLFTMWVQAPWAWASEQVALFALAAWCLWRRAPVWSAGMLPLVCVVVLALVQLALGTTADRWETTGQLYTWLAWLAAFWIALSEGETLIEWTPALGVAIAVLAIAHRTTSHGRVFWFFETGRPSVMGVFPYDNQYAAFVLLVLPLALTRAVRGRSVNWMVGSAVLVASVVSSASVAGAALVLVETLVVLAMLAAEMKWSWGRRAAVAGGVLVLAAVIGSVGGWGDMIADLERHNALQLRRELTGSTIEMARERPLAGWGLGTWTEVYPAFARFDDGIFDNAAHDDWAQWASDGGVPMVLLMLAFAMLIARQGRQGIGLLMVLGYSVIEFHFQERPQFGCYFFALSGATLTIGLFSAEAAVGE